MNNRQIKFRIEENLRSRLVRQAKQNKRSLNSEIIEQIKCGLTIPDVTDHIMKVIIYTIRQELKVFKAVRRARSGSSH